MGVEWESISARLIFGPTTQCLRKSTAFKTAGAAPATSKALRSELGAYRIDGSII